MLQKYFPILGEVNSPLAALAALDFTAASAKVALTGISNEVLEVLLWAEVEETSARKAEIEINLSQLEAARKAAIKESRALRYRAAMAARSARKISAVARKISAVARRFDAAKASLKGLSGLSINFCRVNAANAQAAVRAATNSYNAALEAVEVAIEGGDIRSIRSAVAALKAAVRTLEVRHLEFRFAREMLAISLARHSA